MRTIALEDLKISDEQRNLLWPWHKSFPQFYNIAIMLTLGWSIVPAGEFLPHWLHKGKETCAIDSIPDFHGSLDACNCFPFVLSPDQMTQYAGELEKIVREEGEMTYPHWRKLNPSRVVTNSLSTPITIRTSAF